MANDILMKIFKFHSKQVVHHMPYSFSVALFCLGVFTSLCTAGYIIVMSIKSRNCDPLKDDE